MGRIGELGRKLLFLVRQQEFDRDLEEEMRFHLEMKVRQNCEEGLQDDEAKHVARRQVGNLLLLRERSRDMWGWNWLDALARDLKFALRALRKSPGFTFVAVVTLGTGIGANTAIFSVLDAVMLRPLPYQDAQNLVAIRELVVKDPPARLSTSSPRFGSISYDRHREASRLPVATANLSDYSRLKVFSGTAAFVAVAMNVTESGPPERLWGERVTADYFSVLDVHPLVGRTFGPVDSDVNAGRVVVISHELWQGRFAGAPSIGRMLRLDGKDYEVVGVLPPGFQAPEQFGAAERLSFYIPLDIRRHLDRADHNASAIARLAPGISIAQAQAELDAVSTRLSETHPKSNKNIRSIITPLREEIVRNYRMSLLVLLTAVGLMLLIASANVANLLLVRGVGKQHEIGLRFSLGASRLRVVRELAIQNGLLGLLACTVGLALAFAVRNVLLGLAPADMPRLDGIQLDRRVLVFAGIISVFTTMLFGLFPALQATRHHLSATLAGRHRNLASGSVMFWRRALMIGQVALSYVLLIAAGLLLRSYVSMNAVDLGFRTNDVLAASIDLPAVKYSDPSRQLAFFQDLATRLSGLPGVKAVTFANRLPLRGGWGGPIQIEGDTAETVRDAEYQAVSEQYFDTLGISLMQRRLLRNSDQDTAPPVAVVNQEFVRRYFLHVFPIAQRIRRSAREPWLTIVGVAADIHRSGKGAPVVPQVYLSAAQTKMYPLPLFEIAVRAQAGVNASSLASAIQKLVWAIDKDQPITNVRTLSQVVQAAAAPQRFQTMLMSVFAFIALSLALVGIYGVVSYAVSQRTAEIGVRMALGATRVSVLKLVARQAAVSAAIGTAIGFVLAVAMSRYMASLLFSVRPSDPLTFFAVALALAATAVSAVLVPARRATHIDPIEALRYE